MNPFLDTYARYWWMPVFYLGESSWTLLTDIARNTHPREYYLSKQQLQIKR